MEVTFVTVLQKAVLIIDFDSLSLIVYPTALVVLEYWMLVPDQM